LAGGLNLYGFADGDPVNFSDPFGLDACTKEELSGGRETVANKGGPICVQARDYKAQEKLLKCTANQFSLGREAVYAGAAQVDKKAAGYIVQPGQSKTTNVISAYARRYGPEIDIPTQTLRTAAKRLTGAASFYSVLGRLNVAAAAFSAGYDLGSIAGCVANDK